MATLACIAPFGFSFDPTRFLAAYHSLGCRTCQFYRNEQRPPTIAEALKSAELAGLRFDSIHGVFGFHIDPSSPDERHRKRCLEIYETEGRLATDLGGPLVVVHPSAWNPGMRMMTRAEIEAASAPRWPRLDDFMRRLAEVGQRLGVTYLIENQPMNCPLGHDTIKLAQAVQAVGSSHIRMCLDTGHAHMTGDLVEQVRSAMSVIAYFHIHDNDSKVDDHRMPGDGNIAWDRLAAVLRESGTAAPRMLEVFYDESRVEELAQNGLATKLAAACATD
ncbi:MAG: sugar phosphate isomerase/epimerase family protein [Phycisphaerales bacterium]